MRPESESEGEGAGGPGDLEEYSTLVHRDLGIAISGLYEARKGDE